MKESNVLSPDFAVTAKTNTLVAVRQKRLISCVFLRVSFITSTRLPNKTSRLSTKIMWRRLRNIAIAVKLDAVRKLGRAESGVIMHTQAEQKTRQIRISSVRFSYAICPARVKQNLRLCGSCCRVARGVHRDCVPDFRLNHNRPPNLRFPRNCAPDLKQPTNSNKATPWQASEFAGRKRSALRL